MENLTTKSPQSRQRIKGSQTLTEQNLKLALIGPVHFEVFFGKIRILAFVGYARKTLAGHDFWDLR